MSEPQSTTRERPRAAAPRRAREPAPPCAMRAAVGSVAAATMMRT